MKKARVLIATTSAVGNRGQFWFLKNGDAGISLESLLLPRLPLRSFNAQLMGCFLQSLRALPRLHQYDAILSLSTMNGLGIALLQTATGCGGSPPHIMIDIALPRLVRPTDGLAVAIAKSIFSSPSRIVCFASRQKQFWEHTLGARGRAVFAPLGIDAEEFIPMDAKREDFILSVGRAGRDYATLMAAAEVTRLPLLVIHSSRDVIVVPEDRQGLKGVAIPTNVLVTSEVPYEDYKRLLSSCRFVVLCLRDENYATGQTVLLQAMAMGKAVIATRTTGTEDYLVDGETGIFVAPESPSDLEKKIRRLWCDEGETQRLGRNARCAVEKNFTYQHTAQKVSALIADVVECH